MAGRLDEVSKPVLGLSVAVPSTSTPDYVSLKNWNRCQIRIEITNGATVTGSAITLKQATAVAGTGEKALAFTRMLANTDAAAGDDLTETTVSSNTFTTDTTNAKQLVYVLDVKSDDLDVSNDFDCIRAGTGDGANITAFNVGYTLYEPRYAPTKAVDATSD